jgi:hypothetical protein
MPGTLPKVAHSSRLADAAHRWDGQMGARLDSDLHTAIDSEGEEGQDCAEWSTRERSHLAGAGWARKERRDDELGACMHRHWCDSQRQEPR